MRFVTQRRSAVFLATLFGTAAFAQTPAAPAPAATATASKAAPSGPRPLSPEDPIYRKALELLKTPAKKAA